jgi:hypothetical protein
MVMIFSTDRAGSLMNVSKELFKYKLDFVDKQEVRWDRRGTEQRAAKVVVKVRERLAGNKQK